MPENWKTYKLGDISEIIMGQSPKGATTNNSGKGLPLLNGPTEFGYSYPTPTQFTVDPKKVSQIGDLLFCVRGSTTGRMNLSDQPYAIGRGIGAFRGKNGFSTKYIKYLIDFYLDRMLALCTGSTFPNLSRSDLENFNVKSCSPQESNSISSILSALDDKIELNLQMNKILEEMAMALYNHWFVDFGPFQDEEFVESELGEIPKGWEVKSVQDFGKVITGKTPSKKFPEHFGEEILFVTPTDFKSYGKHITTAARGISISGIEKHKNSILPENSVIVTCIGSDMGKIAVNKDRCLTNQQINSLITEHYLYLYLFFKSNYNLLKMLAGDGTTMPIINKTSFQNIKVILPPQNILKEFETQIQDWDEQMHLNTIENQTLIQLRDTLLPKLISGEVRVKDAEKTLSEVL